MDWINAPVTNVIKFGPGITPAEYYRPDGSRRPRSTCRPPSSWRWAETRGSCSTCCRPMWRPVQFRLRRPVDIVFEFQDEDGDITSDHVGGRARHRQRRGRRLCRLGSEDGETLVGSLADDQIYGNGGDDRIDARAGNDGVYGGMGNDVLVRRRRQWTSFSATTATTSSRPARTARSVSGGNGNDVYLFNAGDGALFVDNAPGMAAGEADTISFGGGIAPQNVMAYVDEYGTLTLFVPGSSRSSAADLVRGRGSTMAIQRNSRRPGGRQRAVRGQLGQRAGVRPGEPGRANEAALFGATRGDSGRLVRPGQRRDHRHGRSGWR